MQRTGVAARAGRVPQRRRAGRQWIFIGPWTRAVVGSSLLHAHARARDPLATDSGSRVRRATGPRVHLRPPRSRGPGHHQHVEVKAGPVPSCISRETIATPRAYTGRASRSRLASPRSSERVSRISRCGTQTISLGAGLRLARSTRRSRAAARRSRVRGETSWRARTASATLPSGLSPRANSRSRDSRWVHTWMRTASPGRSSSVLSVLSAPSSSSTRPFSALRRIMMPVVR
jgi:hypothetical protein